ncbi:MAG: Xaa-Pro peptidase family protein [Chloroflexota bacterium]
MPEFGTMGVDWEERIDFDRLRRERLQKARDAMAAAGADVLLVFRQEDVRYLTGHRSHMAPVIPHKGPVVVLPKDGDPLLFTPDFVHARMRHTWLKPENVQGGANNRYESTFLKWAEEIRGKLGSLLEGRVGIDLWTPPMVKWMPQAFPKAEFVDGKEILYQAQMVKTIDEIECQRTVTAITEAGFQALLDSLKPGVRECELLAVAWQKFTELGSEWTQCSNIVTSGPSTAPYRRFTSDRIIREGDLVIVDIGACFNGYWGDFTRTFVCGNIMPTKEQIALCQECYDTLFNACAQARIGKTNVDVAKVLNDPETNPNSQGLSSGHGAGISPWEPPYFDIRSILPLPPDSEAIVPFQKNMYFSIEPYAGQEGIGGFRLENQMLVTDGDPEIITTFPFDERLLKKVHPLDKTTGRVFRPGR